MSHTPGSSWDSWPMGNVLFHSWLVLDIHCAPCSPRLWVGHTLPYLPAAFPPVRDSTSLFSISSVDGSEQSPRHCPHDRAHHTWIPRAARTQCLHVCLLPPMVCRCSDATQLPQGRWGQSCPSQLHRHWLWVSQGLSPPS